MLLNKVHFGSWREVQAEFDIEETAHVLRVGRGQPYELDRIWRVTGGLKGIPNVSCGSKTKRVSKAAIMAFLQIGTQSIMNAATTPVGPSMVIDGRCNALRREVGPATWGLEIPSEAQFEWVVLNA
jgi:hypothetical protein